MKEDALFLKIPQAISRTTGPKTGLFVTHFDTFYVAILDSYIDILNSYATYHAQNTTLTWVHFCNSIHLTYYPVTLNLEISECNTDITICPIYAFHTRHLSTSTSISNNLTVLILQIFMSNIRINNYIWQLIFKKNKKQKKTYLTFKEMDIRIFQLKFIHPLWKMLL